MMTDPSPRRAPGVLRIPPVAYETRSWRPQRPELFSRAELRRQTGDYASSITPQIASWTTALPAGLLADIEDATLALRDFDLYALSRLGVGSPSLGPMSAILLRTESASSSQIEQLTASAKQIALAEIDEGGKPNARVVVGNVRAMEAALRLADRIDRSTILEMHRQLLRHQRGMEDEAGHLREDLVWIGGRDTAGPREADFVPQQHERVPESLDDLISFLDRDDLSVLVQVAVAHAQFETIHPFVDGNGRTGRALAHAILRNKRIAVNTTVPISAGLLTDLDGYFDALTTYREGDASEIVRRFASASRFATSTGRELVDGLQRAVEVSRDALAGVRPQSLAWKMLPRLVAQPVVNTRYLQHAFEVPAVTVLRALDTLVERGILTEKTGYARNRVWQHEGVLSELDAYSEKIRRSSRRRH